MRRLRSVCRLIVVGVVLMTASIVAQERGGSIVGTVTDAGHYVLPGARIEIDPKGPTSVSDQQGRFAIQNVPPGDYTLTISYVGLLPYSARLTISSGQTERVDAVLQVAGVKEEVTVSAS